MEIVLLLIIGVFLIYRMMRVEERMNKLEHDMFRDKQDALWTEELEKQYWEEQIPKPSITPKNAKEMMITKPDDFYGKIDFDDDLEQQFWNEQPPEPFATPEEVEKYNIDGKK
jgi:hypothetical protein